MTHFDFKEVAASYSVLLNKAKSTYLLMGFLCCFAGNVFSSTTKTLADDTIPPVAIAQDVTVTLSSSGTGSTTAEAVDNGSSDESGIASITLSQTDFNCSNVGANPVTLTVTDVHGNVSTADAIVTVVDITRPTVVTRNGLVVLNANGTGSITPSGVTLVASDACGIASSTLSKSTFDCSNIGDNVVSLTVMDVNGNTTIVNATIMVRDRTAPVAIAQDATVTLVNGVAYITAAQIDNGSHDACGIETIMVSPNTFSCSNIGENEVTLTVTDISGNTTTTTAIVTVIGATLPTVSISQGVQPDFTQGGAIVLTASSPTATSYSWVDGPSTANYSVFSSGTYTVNATDAGGCSASASIEINYNASDLLSAYTIIGTRDNTELKNNVNLLNGGVGNTDDSRKVVVDNSFVQASGTFVRANEIEIKGAGIVTNPILSATPLSILPPFLTNPFCSSTNNKNIADNATVILTDTVMGQVVIGKNATVTFTGSSLFFKSLEVRDGAKVNFTQCAVAKVCSYVVLKKGVKFNSVSPVQLTMYIAQKFLVAEGVEVTTNVYAKSDLLVRARQLAPTKLTGLFIGGRVKAEEYVTFDWNTSVTCSNVMAKTTLQSEQSGLIQNYFDVSVYPNPTNSSFNLGLFSSSSEPILITVYDMNGKLMESTVADNAVPELMIGADYAPGMYIINITQSDKTKMLRLIKTQ
ncbi:MAG: T9SS type A sorting domain-containing protein [Bacteroidota bacterium]